MIVTNCPRCGEAFRVPGVELPDDAYAQCPWCRDTFPVSDVLKLLPPVLKVLSADGRPIDAARHQAAALGVAGLSGASASPGMETVADEAEFFIDEPAGSSELDADDLNFESPSTAETVIEDEMSKSFDVGEPSPNELYSDDLAEDDLDEPGHETVTSETVSDETWSEHQADVTDDDDLVDFEVEHSEDNWGGDEASAARDEIAPVRVSPGPARRTNRQGSLIGTLIKVVLGGLMAIPLGGGLLMAIGRTPDWGFWPFNGSGESNRSVTAARPAELSTNSLRPTATQDRPSGRMLKPDLGNDDFNVASDPVESAREQRMAEPSVDNFSPREQTDSPIVLPPASDLALKERTATDSSASEDAAMRPGPDLAAPSLEVPAVETDEAAPRQIAPIEISESRTEAGETTPPSVEQPRDLNSQSSDLAIESPVREANIGEATAEPEASTEPAVKPVPTAVRSATTEDPAELVAIADRAGKMIEAVAKYDGDRKERVRRMLLTYENIATACNLAHSGSAALNKLASRLRNSSLLNEIGDATPEWLVYTSRNSEGVVLVGIAGAGSTGPTVTLDSGTVVSVSGDIQLPAAGRVLAMGRIIDENSVEVVLVQPLP